MEYLKIASIIDSFALDGTMKIFVTTSNESLRFQKGKVIFLLLDNEYKPLTISSYKKAGNVSHLKVEEINSPEEVKLYKGKELVVEKTEEVLKKDEYYFVDLVGCKIIDENEVDRGVVIKVEVFPAQATLKVNGKIKDYYVPFVKVFIKKVDIKNKLIQITYLEGME